ncbi:MAG: HAD-IA family hydrolase [Anaerolineales bacterium]|nr:HAD-IA family hydrolase [Anaerolineales bacterium]
MKKALVFDFGGVLMRTVDFGPRRSWEMTLGLPEWGLSKLVFDNHVASKATVGVAQTADVWNFVAAQLRLSEPELDKLQRDFWAGDCIDTVLTDFVGQQSGTCRTAILSNAWPGARQFFKSLPDLSVFETLVISAEEGVAKPAMEIYRRTLERVGVTAAQTMFIDDMEENVVAARSLGMAGVVFENTEQTLTAVHQWLSG